MKILFLQKDIFAKPGIMSLSAILKNGGHECDLLIDDLEKDIVRKALTSNPDIIAFSITSGEHLWMNQVGRKIRKEFPKMIICGGPHPTFYPEVLLEDYLDAICIGEAEEAFADFIDSLSQDKDIIKIQNFNVKRDGQIFKNDLRPLIQDLDSLPFFDRAIYMKYDLFKKSPGSLTYHSTMITTRGCPYKCAFCFNKSYNQLYHGEASKLRRRSVSNVIDELSQLKQDKNFKFVNFEDDSFTLPPREWLIDFLERYKNEIGIPFRIMSPANQFDEELMAKLKDANCHSLKMGIESGNEHFRINVLQKNVKNAAIVETARLSKKYGVRFQTFNVVGCPGETLDMVFETFELNRKIRPDFVWCSLLNPYPKTDIFDAAIASGCIDSSFDCTELGHSYFINTPMQIENQRQISNLQKLMFFAILLRLPRWTLNFLIKLPVTKFYNLLFAMTFFLGLYRINKNSLYDQTKLSLLQFFRYTRYD